MATRRRQRPAIVYRDRDSERLDAFKALIAGVPLLSAGAPRYVRELFAEISAAPADHIYQAEEIACLLSKHGAPWSLVLSVLVAEHDHDHEQDVPGWAGWREMKAAHEEIRSLMADIERDHLPNDDARAAFLGLFGCATPSMWDGKAARSLDEYATRPGDFSPDTARAFVDAIRDAFRLPYDDPDDYENDPAMQRLEARLDAIENASLAVEGRPLREAESNAQDRVADPVATGRSLASVLAEDTPEIDTDLDEDEDEGTYSSSDDDDDAPNEDDLRARAAERAQARRLFAATWPALTRGEQTVAREILALYAKGMNPTAPALAEVLGKSPEAAQKAKERLFETMRAHLSAPPG